MNFGEVVFLGALQGITEFFPISSSGHLLLAENFLGLDVENLKAFDVVLHAGTLLALLILFWKTWFQILRGFFVKSEKAGRSLFLKLVAVTIPAAIVGLSLNDWIDGFTRGQWRVVIVASFFVVIAVLLVLAERLGKKNSDTVGWRQVGLMGIFQAFALLPGISRSGATIAAGMLGGLKREVAAKFSFLMLAPATAGAVILIGKKVWAGELTLPPIEFTLVGFFISAISSFIFASLLLRLVKKYSLIWFAVYLLIVGGILFLTGTLG
jgi:undecaprenyl-diphosphatase